MAAFGMYLCFALLITVKIVSAFGKRFQTVYV